jgi:hypothetical protein
MNRAIYKSLAAIVFTVLVIALSLEGCMSFHMVGCMQTHIQGRDT